MEDVSHVMMMWEKEGVIVMMILVGVLVFHYVSKLWSAPADAVLGVILGLSAGAAFMAIYLTHHMWGLHLTTRALWFLVLYVWCVLGMLFFAAKHTRRLKLFLGLVSQAGILLALFVLF
jgi:hypothetical protein